MKPVFDTQTGTVYTRSVRKFSKIMIATMVVGSAIVAFSEHAWSFEQYYGRINENTATSSLSKKSLSHPVSRDMRSVLADSHKKVSADTCLPLLSSIRHTSPHNAMDRSQHSAGKAAALGLVFGVRFALTPADAKSKSAKSKASLGFWPSDASTSGTFESQKDRSALAVAAYRQCQKKQALKALGKLRWTR